MPRQETGKQRAIRVPLDYFKGRDTLTKWKLRLAAVAAVLALVWCGSLLVRGARGNLAYSSGPVAAVHATWESNCNACHVGTFLGPPIRQQKGPAMKIGDVHASDGKCDVCHKGPIHHEKQKPEDTPSCGGCHREHQGRDASLIRLAESDCTQCHGNLPQHMNGETPYATKITSFATDHPEFRILDKERNKDGAVDPGKLKFNHALHMAPGLNPSGGDPNTFKRISNEEDRRRYGWKSKDDDNKPIQLDCGACHRLDSADFKLPRLAGLPDSVLAARNSGAHMLPITYENQCMACHPLTVPDPSDDLTGKKKLPPLTVPHRVQPAKMREDLTGLFTNRVLQNQPQLLERPLPGRPVPGNSVLGAAGDSARALVESYVDKADGYLFKGTATCQLCHYVEMKAGKADRIVPPAVKQVWYDHARFDHGPHRSLNCQECHPNADPFKDASRKDRNPSASDKSSDILLPGIAVCKQCHVPATRTAEGLKGGARHDCTECHSYHNRDAEGTLQGIGAAARGPRQPHSIQEFLSSGGK